MSLDLFSEEASGGKRPPPVSDHSVFAFWVVAYTGGSTVMVYRSINKVDVAVVAFL